MKGQKLPHGCVFSLNPSVEPQPELAEPEAEPVPPTVCVLFAVYELLVAGGRAGGWRDSCLSFSSLVQGREAEGPS